ncbi:MAG TPA: YjjG family noncanonical pyrimidine nucleotidase [Bacteroidia bacterium]|nr:YjjG family noncanonical pyrimidine nucleotidase [Bacteroidia bacterium]HNT79169.1 YjjG family noncanonical pyrimidine nucleotidase [Bacteroidia bacterium]
MNQYDHIFFDLDHTLWDFNHNSKETLLELYNETHLQEFTPFDHFFSIYQHTNEELWKAYHQGRIKKEELRITRFRKVFKELNFKNTKELAQFFADEYVKRSPYRGKLIPGALEIISQLKEKYKLHIITNGFKEVQHIKLISSGLIDHFNHIIISEEVGYQKPNPQIFKFAEKKCSSIFSSCLMIGDNEETDINGAYNSGWDTVWFNPDNKKAKVPSTYKINKLEELSSLL